MFLPKCLAKITLYQSMQNFLSVLLAAAKQVMFNHNIQFFFVLVLLVILSILVKTA